jgi:hypothetical protein
VIHLLTHAELPFYGYDLPEVAKMLRDSEVSVGLFAQLEERALNLGIVLSGD